MLTLQELKKCVAIPELEAKIPTVKQLREYGTVAASERLGEDTEISVYENGYVLYWACGHFTVFPLHLCSGYVYEADGNVIHLSEQFFEKEKWSLRLILEGEDRLNHNQDAKERKWNISCNTMSDKWMIEDDLIESALERLAERELIEDLFRFLTERQKAVVWRYFFQGKTQKQIADELRISNPAVSIILSKAVHRIRKKYPMCDTNGRLYSRKEGCCESGKGKRHAWKKA